MTLRRDFLATSSTGLLAAFLASGSRAQEQDVDASLAAEERANIQLVDQFCKGWEAMELSAVFATMKEDAIYRI